jgi:hypothetical protein
MGCKQNKETKNRERAHQNKLLAYPKKTNYWLKFIVSDFIVVQGGSCLKFKGKLQVNKLLFSLLLLFRILSFSLFLGKTFTVFHS